MIFVALSSFAEFDRRPLAMLEASGVPFAVHSTGKRITTSELLSDAPEATVIVAGVEPYDRPTLDALPKLRCISRCGVGIDSIDPVAARERGVEILNTPDAPTAAVAELALTMMLGLCRNLPRQTVAARAHEWTRLKSHLLGGRRVGIIGLGRIGRRVATLVRAFGSEVVAADPVVDDHWCAAQGVRLVSLDELLSISDIISIHASRAAEVPLRIGAAQLALVRPGAILINLGRGEMVEEHALHEALKSGKLFGAGLDVYPKEPYTGILCDLDNVILTPHTATLTVETRAEMEFECVRKALAFIHGTLTDSDKLP